MLAFYRANIRTRRTRRGAQFCVALLLVMALCWVLQGSEHTPRRAGEGLLDRFFGSTGGEAVSSKADGRRTKYFGHRKLTSLSNENSEDGSEEEEGEDAAAGDTAVSDDQAALKQMKGELRRLQKRIDKMSAKVELGEKRKERKKKGKKTKKPKKATKPPAEEEEEEDEEHKKDAGENNGVYRNKAAAGGNATAPVKTQYLRAKGKATECPGRGMRMQSRTNPKFFLCTHGPSDVISSWFLKDGYWRDCLPLPAMAEAAFSHAAKSASTTIRVVEVGGNIGACTMQMSSLLPDTHITVFEPLQGNYNLLGASVDMNEKALKSVDVITAGAGEVEATKEIFTEVGNQGNSVVMDKAASVSKKLRQDVNFRPDGEIHIVRLDDYVKDHVHFLKLDCQGSEISALLGAPELLGVHGVDVIRAEFDGKLIKATGKDPAEFLTILWKYGYTVYDEQHPENGAVTKEGAERFVAERFERATDIVALAAPVAAKISPQRFQHQVNALERN